MYVFLGEKWLSLCVRMCVCACVRVCVCEREREIYPHKAMGLVGFLVAAAKVECPSSEEGEGGMMMMHTLRVQYFLSPNLAILSSH